MERIRTMPKDKGQPDSVPLETGPTPSPSDGAQEPGVKLYSLRAIGGATFLGGPLGGGLLIRRNELNLGNAQGASAALFVALGGTALLACGMAFTPDQVMEKIPDSVIPAIYTALIVYWAKRRQGAEVLRHQSLGGQMYSGWKAFGVAMVSLLISLMAFLGAYAFKPESPQMQAYQAGWNAIAANEERSNTFAELPDSASIEEHIKLLDETCLPAWRDCLTILDKMEAIEGLDSAHLNQLKAAREYANLQIERYTLIRKALAEDSDAYNQQLTEVMSKLEAVDLSLKE